MTTGNKPTHAWSHLSSGYTLDVVTSWKSGKVPEQHQQQHPPLAPLRRVALQQCHAGQASPHVGQRHVHRTQTAWLNSRRGPLRLAADTAGRSFGEAHVHALDKGGPLVLWRNDGSRATAALRPDVTRRFRICDGALREAPAW